jgi:hypothetical protein
MHYSSSMKAHLAQLLQYLSREGTGKDGGQAKLYGTEKEIYRKNMAGRNFRIFLSPGSSMVPLETLARAFIKKVELASGYKLYWQAAEHYNTAHPHVHLLINGVDQNGWGVRFPRDLVKYFMRENARDICTTLVGRRTRGDMELEKKALLAENRFTRLDAEIEKLSSEGRISFDEVTKDTDRFRTRLDYLVKLQLCKWKDRGYILSPRWKQTLQAQGRYNVFLEARGKLRFARASALRVYEPWQGKKTGMITRVYKIDESSDNHATVLETARGEAYFIPLYAKPDLKEGEAVTLIPKKNQKGRLTPVFLKAASQEIRDAQTGIKE